MPTFDSIAELENYVVQRMQPAVRNVQEKIHQIIFNYLNAYYGEYEPRVAIRTYQILDSLVKSDVKRSGNGWEAEVYFDLGRLSHPRRYTGQDGSLVTSDWSEARILHGVMIEGTHGGAMPGLPVWSEAMNTVNPAWIQWLKQELIAAGIPIQ